MTFKLFCSFLILLSITSCVKVKENLDVKIIGHAGGGLNQVYALYAPNSLISIENAIISGVNGVEVDLQVSLDTVGFLYHEIASIDDLDNDMIHQNNSDVIIDAGLTKLNDIKEIVKISNSEVYLDLKIDGNLMDLTAVLPKYQKVLDEFKFGLDSMKLFIISRNSNFLNQLTNSGYQLIYESDDFNEQLYTSLNLGFEGVLLKEENCTKTNIEICRNNSLMLGTISEDSFKKLVKKYNENPDFIILDNIHNGLMLKK